MYGCDIIVINAPLVYHDNMPLAPTVIFRTAPNLSISICAKFRITEAHLIEYCRPKPGNKGWGVKVFVTGVSSEFNIPTLVPTANKQTGKNTSIMMKQLFPSYS